MPALTFRPRAQGRGGVVEGEKAEAPIMEKQSFNPEVLRYPEEAIKKSVEEFGTPFFLFEEGRIRERCREMQETFRKYFSDFRPIYAAKANFNPYILKIIQEEGFGLDCSSSAEVWMCNKLKAHGMHTGNNLSHEEITEILDTPNLLLNLDDLSMWEKVEELGRIPEFISFRINTGFAKEQGGVSGNLLSGENAKYGVPHEKAVEAYRRARDAGVARFGIHAMTGSNVRDENYFSQVSEKLWEVMGKLHAELGITFEIMNPGGGYGVPYRPEEASLNLDKIASQMAEVFERKSKEYGIPMPALMVEPGRWITCDSGFLVGRVRAINEKYKTFVGIDVSTNAMPRPWAYGAYHHISVVGKETEDVQRKVVRVVGSICENSDQWTQEDRLLPEMELGDIVVIHDCGAHGCTMGHNYNGRMRPKEVLLTPDGSFRLIREEETIPDLLSRVPSGWENNNE